jgi:hypothetical protein
VEQTPHLPQVAPQLEWDSDHDLSGLWIGAAGKGLRRLAESRSAIASHNGKLNCRATLTLPERKGHNTGQHLVPITSLSRSAPIHGNGKPNALTDGPVKQRKD